MQQLEHTDDPTEAFTAADHLASRAVIDRFYNRKHEHHLRTIFAIQRRKRLMGRLQAIRAALDLANGFLSEDETLSEEFLHAWQDKTTEKYSPEHPDKDKREAREKEERTMSKEERRIQHLKETLTPLVGSVEQSRQLLRAFEAKLPDLRAGLVAGNGWIEIFFVPKRRYKKEVVAYALAWSHHLERGSPMPPAIEQAIDPRVAVLIQHGAPFPKELRDLVYHIEHVGPYAKYRWRENGQIYTVSLGLLNDYPEYPFIPEGF